MGSVGKKIPTISANGKAKEKAEPGTRIASRLSLVPVTGVEPVRYRYHWILSFTGYWATSVPKDTPKALSGKDNPVPTGEIL